MSHTIETIVPALRRFAFSLTGNHADADDLLQNTVEKLLQHESPTGAELLPWAFRICRNQWIDDFRAKKVRGELLDLSEPEEAVGPDHTQQIIAEISLTQVATAIDALPESQREVLSLVAVEGLSYQQASDILAVPTGTIMSRLARARIRLAECLQLFPKGVQA